MGLRELVWNNRIQRIEDNCQPTYPTPIAGPFRTYREFRVRSLTQLDIDTLMQEYIEEEGMSQLPIDAYTCNRTHVRKGVGFVQLFNTKKQQSPVPQLQDLEELLVLCDGNKQYEPEILSVYASWSKEGTDEDDPTPLITSCNAVGIPFFVGNDEVRHNSIGSLDEVSFHMKVGEIAQRMGFRDFNAYWTGDAPLHGHIVQVHKVEYTKK